jgi:hypothetical protein
MYGSNFGYAQPDDGSSAEAIRKRMRSPSKEDTEAVARSNVGKVKKKRSKSTINATKITAEGEVLGLKYLRCYPIARYNPFIERQCAILAHIVVESGQRTKSL